MRRWLWLSVVVVPLAVASSGCEQMWNGGANDPQPTPQQAREQQAKLEQDRYDRQHVAQQDPDFRQSLRNGDVSGDY
jgi:hypothetical protein